jgi:hypothetical protein
VDGTVEWFRTALRSDADLFDTPGMAFSGTFRDVSRLPSVVNRAQEVLGRIKHWLSRMLVDWETVHCVASLAWHFTWTSVYALFFGGNVTLCMLAVT